MESNALQGWDVRQALTVVVPLCDGIAAKYSTY